MSPPRKAVDRLLRIAHDDQRRVRVVEDPVEDLPLHRVGVLELVDQGHREPLPESLPELHVVHDRITYAGEQTVERDVASGRQPGPDLIGRAGHELRESHVGGFAGRGLDLDAGIVEDGPHEPDEGIRPGQSHLALQGRRRQQVGGDRDDEL